MSVLTRLFHGEAGATKVALVLAAAVAAYLVLAGSWATAIFELIDQFGARLPL